MKNILLYSFLLFASFVGAQTQYYVAPPPAGDNGNVGSFDNPWETITYGIGQLAPGDVLFLKAGTYEEKIDINVSGTPSAKITIRNYQDDEVILDALNSTNDLPIIYTNQAYLRIEGLHLKNNQVNNAFGIFIEGTAHHIEIVNNKISNINFSTDPNAEVNSNTNAVPLGIQGNDTNVAIHDISIIGNEVFDNRTGYSENITLGGNVDGFLVESNTIHDNTNIGIDMTGNYGECPTPAYDHARNGLVRNNLVYNCDAGENTAAGIYVDGGRDIIVENNICHHNGYGGEIGCEQDGETTNVTFRNNIFYGNKYAGMHIGGYDPQTTGNVINAVVSNNTFFQNDAVNYNGELIFSRSTNTHVFNNVFFLTGQNVYLYAYRTQTDMVLDYNLVFNAAGQNQIETTVNGNSYTGLQNFYNATGYGANSSFGDPLLADATADPPDFHLTANSPAINTGDPNYSPSAGERDMDGENRANDTIDCGADEYYAPMAVEYLSVLSGTVDGERVKLSWTTAAEMEADYFGVEKYEQDSWRTLETIEAGRSSYVIYDENPVSGENIYRLKQVDISGKYSYSTVISVFWQGIKPVVYPNPSLTGSFYIKDLERDHWTIEVTNLQGQILFTGKDARQVSGISAGGYLVLIYDDAGNLIQTVPWVCLF